MKLSLRNLIQIGFLILFLILMWILKGFIHLVCPFNFICSGPLWLKYFRIIFPIGFFISLFFIIITYFRGRIFCSWVCPVGTVQDIATYLKRDIGKKKKRKAVPSNKHLVILKYLFTLLLLISAYVTGVMVTVEYCPIFFTSVLGDLTFIIPYFFVVAVFLIIIFAIPRGFCRYICPLSVFFETAVRICTAVKGRNIFIDRKSCVECRVCESCCPMGNNIIEDFDPVNCINCRECEKRCPKNKGCEKTLKI